VKSGTIAKVAISTQKDSALISFTMKGTSKNPIGRKSEGRGCEK
jgi:hypothetical protein